MRIAVLLGVLLILASCAAAWDARGPHPAPPMVARGARPNIAVFPPNASRVTAKVLKRAVWPPRSLANARPPVEGDETLYSLTLEIGSAAPARADLDSMAHAGAVVEAFSSAPLSADLVGKSISATLERVGDTYQGSRWWISGIQDSASQTK